MNTMQQQRFDIAVIGAGLIGSAAARHVAEKKTCSVCLIGPDDNDTEGCHGAWFDEGRITRAWDINPYFAHISIESIKRYRAIEEASGIKFFSEVGFVSMAGADFKNVDALKNGNRSLHLLGIEANLVTEESKNDWFPYFNFPAGFVAYHEPVGSGHISPRLLVAAQRKLAMEAGCEVIDGVVDKVDKESDRGGFVLELADGGAVVRADKVIMATGSNANLRPSLKSVFPLGQELDMALIGTSVAYLEVAPETAEMLRAMPTMTAHFNDGVGKLQGTYILPPITYPDGKCYLKLGHEDPYDEVLKNDISTVEAWYQRKEGNPEAVEELVGFINRLIPGMKVLGVTGGACVTTRTSSRECPFIDEVSLGAFVAVGGCGRGAKCSDEIGRIAADLAVDGAWTTKVPRQACKAKWRKVQ